MSKKASSGTYRSTWSLGSWPRYRWKNSQQQPANQESVLKPHLVRNDFWAVVVLAVCCSSPELVTDPYCAVANAAKKRAQKIRMSERMDVVARRPQRTDRL